MPGLSEGVRWLLDLVYPPRCVSCQRLGAVVCAPCLSSIKPPETPICVRCGATIPRVESLCAGCASGLGPAHLDGLRVATLYAGAARPRSSSITSGR